MLLLLPAITLNGDGMKVALKFTASSGERSFHLAIAHQLFATRREISLGVLLLATVLIGPGASENSTVHMPG
jgi:hypothetical protein